MVAKIDRKIIAGCSPSKSFVHLPNYSAYRRNNSKELREYWVQFHSLHAAARGESQRQGMNSPWKAFKNEGKEEHTSSH